jgi:hypothetical protein
LVLYDTMTQCFYLSFIYLTETHAEDATLARLSYSASLLAEEARLRAMSKLSIKQVMKLAFFFCLLVNIHINYKEVQSNRSYVAFQGNIEIWSHKTGGHLKQVYFK